MVSSIGWLVSAECGGDLLFGVSRIQQRGVILIADQKILEGPARAVPIFFHSGLLKRIVRSSLAAEVSQAAETMDQADFLRAVLAEATVSDFSLRQWLIHCAQWGLVPVLDSRTGYDLLIGANHGDDGRLAIDVASMKGSLWSWPRTFGAFATVKSRRHCKMGCCCPQKAVSAAHFTATRCCGKRAPAPKRVSVGRSLSWP